MGSCDEDNFQEKATPVTFAQVQALLSEHRTQINDELERYRDGIDDRISTMSTSIISGFEKVGDKIATEMKEFRQTLIPSATNERKLDIKVVMPIIYTLCGVITALIVWFTGVKPFIPVLVSQMEQNVEQPSKLGEDPLNR